MTYLLHPLQYGSLTASCTTPGSSRRQARVQTPARRRRRSTSCSRQGCAQPRDRLQLLLLWPQLGGHGEVPELRGIALSEEVEAVAHAAHSAPPLAPWHVPTSGEGTALQVKNLKA